MVNPYGWLPDAWARYRSSRRHAAVLTAVAGAVAGWNVAGVFAGAGWARAAHALIALAVAVIVGAAWRNLAAWRAVLESAARHAAALE
jgi:hypothetical protein